MGLKSLRTGMFAVVTALSGLVVPQPAQAADGPSEAVVVLLADQHQTMTNSGQRHTLAVTDQIPLLNRVHAAKVRQFGVVNGFAATLDAADRQRLATDPRILAVVPDLPITRTKPEPADAASGTPARTSTPDGICPADPAKPLLEPEALQATQTAFADPGVAQAQNLVTGKGVRVGFIADGIDVHNPEFIRPDGSAVFADYQDFSGDGPDAPSSGSEAFGDASAIAAQGNQAYDLSGYVNTVSPLPAGCTIRVRGMAPGASLIGLRAGTSTSSIVAAIDYAVTTGKVDVLNESLGSNPYPDRHTDPISLANHAAAAAGITVVAASGDAGWNNTVGNPAGDPGVISVGASTAFRASAQIQHDMPGLSGWNSGNIASLSSGGVTETNTVSDLVAPGDGGWAVCTPDSARFTGCTNLRGGPSSIIKFGGTSQSAPLTAGAAALVIQAYAATHSGAKPGPALIKRILTGSATDGGDRADAQGAGLLNAYQAVLTAQSIKDTHGAPRPQGDNLIVDQTQLRATAKPGSAQDFPLQVTNTGSHTQLVAAHNRALTKVLADQRGTVDLDSTAAATPKWTSGSGNTFGYVTRKFTIAPGADHLDISIAFSPKAGDPVNLRLLDPAGRLTAVATEADSSGFGHLDVHSPAAGTWTAIFDCNTGTGYHGNITYDVRTSAFTTVGAVVPPVAVVPPGRSATFHVLVRTPENPGDLSAAVQLDTLAGRRSVVPLALRSLVPADGSFTGVLTGGNGSAVAAAQNSFYQFDVPRGRHDLGVGLTLSGDPGQTVFGYLISPDGQVFSQQNNVRTLDENGNPATFGQTLQEFRRDPAPGRWTFVVSVANPVAGTTTAQRFTGTLRFDVVDVHASGLPGSAATVLAAGKPVTTRVTVHNTGVAPESFFADARSTTFGDLDLLPDGPATGIPLPHAGPLSYRVPPSTTKLTATASATEPVTADLRIAFLRGSEVLGRSGTGHVATASVTAPEVSPGPWWLNADARTPGTGTTDLRLVATTQLFDAAVSSSTGNAWLAASQTDTPPYTPLVLQPGESGTITVTITPTAAKGTTVSGVLYIDDFNDYATTGDELEALPYAYTVG